jgi:hypothetical protein
MHITGRLSKLKIKEGSPSSYQLMMSGKSIDLSSCIGQQIQISFDGDIFCEVCHELTPKSYQGCCFNCFNVLAMNDRCVMQPHLCHFAKGTCREPAWGMLHCMQPHIVYLAWTSDLKVGITKVQNIPERWLDQGALVAKVLCKTQSRYHAGLIENHLHQTYSDRTQWQSMLKASSIPQELDIIKEWENAKQVVLNASFSFMDTVEFIDQTAQYFSYIAPGQPKIKSLSLDKVSKVSDVLRGMKGQYLYLDSGVINIRKHTGYQVSINLG